MPFYIAKIMEKYILILPVSLLVVYSQLIMKLRASAISVPDNIVIFQRLTIYLQDPFIISAYSAALLGSFVWLYVVTKLSISVAFPVYIGLTFGLVILGGRFFLEETLTPLKLFSVFLIFTGILIGVYSDE